MRTAKKPNWDDVLSDHSAARMMFFKEDDAPSGTFVDVPMGVYYYSAVQWAKDNGVTKGTSETTFSPMNTCTRAQAVTFLWRWMVK